MLKTYGLKKTGKMISRYPAVILTPILSFWTFGPIKKDSLAKESIIGVSFFYTTLNAIISISSGLFCVIFTYKSFSNFDASRCFNYGENTDCDLFLIGTTIISPLLFIACMCILILRFWELQCFGVSLIRVKNFDVHDLFHHHQNNQIDEPALEMREMDYSSDIEFVY